MLWQVEVTGQRGPDLQGWREALPLEGGGLGLGVEVVGKGESSNKIRSPLTLIPAAGHTAIKVGTFGDFLL